MEVTAAQYTLLTLLLVLYLQIRSYGYRALLHPSFWFLVIWTLSATSFLIYASVGLDYIIYFPDKLVELFNYITFTALCIGFVSWKRAKKTNQLLIQWRPVVSEPFFNKLATLLLAIGLANFLLFSSFDLAANRASKYESAMEIGLSGSLPLYQVLFNVLLGLNGPLLILSGYFIGLYFVGGGVQKLRKELFYPIILNIVQTLQIGGRSGIVASLLGLFFGFLIGLFSYQADYGLVFKKVSKYVLILFAAFTVYSGYINAVREGTDVKNSSSYARWDKHPFLAPFGSLMQYMTDHYPGYQINVKKFDVDNTPLDLGQNTFSCFLSFSVPVFSQIAGFPVSIQHLFNLKEMNVAKGNLEAIGDDWANTTRTVFYVLYIDFGYVGVFYIIFVFVVLSQYFYDRVYFGHKQSIFFIVPLLIVYKLWINTIFSNHLAGNWLAGYLYTYLIFDVLNNYSLGRYKL